MISENILKSMEVFYDTLSPPQNLISILHTFLVMLMKVLPYWLYAEAGCNLVSCSIPYTSTKDPVSLILK